MKISEGIYINDEGGGNHALLPITGGKGHWWAARFGKLSHYAASHTFQLKQGMEWSVSDEEAVVKWWDSDGDEYVGQGPVLEDGNVLRMRMITSTDKSFDDWRFYPVDPKVYTPEWSPADDARLIEQAIADGRATLEGARLAAALGYEGAALVTKYSIPSPLKRTDIIEAIAALGGRLAVRAMVAMMWDEDSLMRYTQNEDVLANKRSVEHKAMASAAKWVVSGSEKDFLAARKAAQKLDDMPQDVLAVLDLGKLESEELVEALTARFDYYIDESEEVAFKQLNATLVPFVLEKRERFA